MLACEYGLAIAEKNSATINIAYRTRGSSSWTTAIAGNNANAGPWVINKNNTVATSSYEVRVIITDAMGEQATQTYVVASTDCFIDKMPGRRRIGIGAYCEADNTFYIAPDMAPRWGDKSLVPAPRNLLDNSDFSIWQRGNTFTNALVVAYWADRWFGSGNLYRTYEKTTQGCKITANTSGIYIGTQQRVATNGLTPGTYTLVWCFTPSAGCKTYQAQAVSAGVRTTEIVKVTVTDADIEQGYVSCIFGIMCLPDGSNIPVGFSFDIHYAALYEGSYTADTLPEYVPKGYAAELAECMRYYYRIKAYWKWVSAGLCTSATEAQIPIHMPVPMRTVPTVTIPTASLIKVRCGAVASQVPTAVNWNSASDLIDYMQMRATVNGATSGDLAMLYFDNGGVIEFSADL